MGSGFGRTPSFPGSLALGGCYEEGVKKGQRYPPEVRSEQEVERLLDACGRSFTGRRNRTLLVLLWRCGLRRCFARLAGHRCNRSMYGICCAGSRLGLVLRVASTRIACAAGGPYTIQVTVNADDPGAGTTVSSDPFSFLYNVTGVLQPVNDTQAQQDPTVFKYGSTIPVTIEVTDCNGTPVSGLSPQVSVEKTAGSTPPTGTDETITSTSGADTGTTMRWSDPIYIYNLATKSLSDSSATYQITITRPFATVTTNFGTTSK